VLSQDQRLLDAADHAGSVHPYNVSKLTVTSQCQMSGHSYLAEQCKAMAIEKVTLGTLQKILIDEFLDIITSDIIKYEDDLEKSKENCHLEFRESILARLRFS
jgi:hypothetical protein